MLKTVEDIYNKLAIEKTIEKVKESNISPYTRKLYEECKSQLPGITFEDFAARISNWNPGKTLIGEKAQLSYLTQNKYPKIKKLAPSGKHCISLHKIPNNFLIKNGKSNIDGIKSFDAINDDGGKITFFILKTVDIGMFSDNMGGGNQDNVSNELAFIIDKLCNNDFIFNNKPVDITIVINGRSSKEIMTACQKIVSNNTALNTKITIATAENL